MSPEALNLLFQALVAGTSVIGAIAWYNQGLNKKFNSLGCKLDKLDRRLDDQKVKLTEIESDVKHNAQKLDDVVSELKAQDERMVDHRTRITVLEKK